MRHSPEPEGEQAGLTEMGRRRETVPTPSHPHLWDSHPQEAMADILMSKKLISILFLLIQKNPVLVLSNKSKG